MDILCKSLRYLPFAALNLLTGPGAGMNQKITLNTHSDSSKRVLIVAPTCVDSSERSECLRLRGFQVDCVVHSDLELRMSPTNSYDLILLTANLSMLGDLAADLQNLNPHAKIACLADCKKPIPPLPC